MSETPAWFRPIRATLFRIWLLRRGLTLGVRAVVRDAEGGVLLVRHSYIPGWHLPGGGVERGETAATALARELREETGVVLAGAPVLYGLFHNAGAFEGDHVAVFLVPDWARPSIPVPSAEIRAAEFFAMDGLPDGTSVATRRRLAEILEGRSPSMRW
jgi:ADP-ribose pyrophosphatase YjhB (NUDIX family)